MARTPTPRVFHPVTITSECHLRGTMGTKRFENLFAYQWNSGIAPNAAELLSLATEVFQTIGPKIALITVGRVVLRECYCRNIDTETAPEATYVPPVPITGSRGGTAASSQDAFSLIKRTGVTGKSHHSSIHFSGFSSSDIVADTISTTLINLILNVAISIITQRVGGRFIPALPSRKLGDSRRLAQLAYENQVVDTMDRRVDEG
jgi:hypothetical protein